MNSERLLVGLRSLRKGGRDVTTLSQDLVHDVSLLIGDVRGVVLVMDYRSAVDHGQVLVEDCRKNFVFDLDQADGVLCNLDRVGRDGRNSVADMTDLVVEADLIMRTWVGVRLAA